MTTYTVSRTFSGDRRTIEAASKIEAARIFLGDDRVKRLESRGHGASLCDAYRYEPSDNAQGEAHVGTIFFHG